ncbi:hypothetical protein [Paenibacillus sp. GXUN7292]|uniref:hypothetical protein n=1 Tax=Paenibacillus sp. GXUN7292 TaxID=3422499 RepID=UPI003D7D819D
MNVTLKALTKVDGQWRKSGEIIKLSDAEAKRLISMGAAITANGTAAVTEQDDVEAMRAELARLQEFERQQLAASAEAKAKAEQEEAERKAAEVAAAKAKAKPDKE